MRKRVIVLLITLLIATISFSQTISIGTEQLKETNLIFLEHKKLLEENALLYKQLENFQKSYTVLSQIDSTRVKEIGQYIEILEDRNKQIEKLTKEISIKDKAFRGWKIGSIIVTGTLALWLLLK